MTILEVIKGNSLFAVFSDSEIQQALGVRTLNSSDTYNPELHLKNVELTIADLQTKLAGIKSFKEGDLSISYNKDALLAIAKYTYQKYGEIPESKGYKVIKVGASFGK